MPRIRMCQKCDQLLTEASQLIRRHATAVNTAIQMARSGYATEQQRQDYTTRLVESFSDAQQAWDTYCEHLIEHGLLPSPK